MPLPASGDAVGAVYDAVADVYDGMMVGEVATPRYQRCLQRFAEEVFACGHAHSKQKHSGAVDGGDSAGTKRSAPNIVVDTSCGSGSMLEELAHKLKADDSAASDANKVRLPSTGTSSREAPHGQQDAAPPVRLLGIDASLEMVKLAQQRVSTCGGTARIGNMLSLDGIGDTCCVGLISYFAAHHVDEEDLARMLRESARVLAPGAPLLLAYWTGDGRPFFEPGLQLDIVNHKPEVVNRLLEENGFVVQLQERQRDPNTGESGLHLLLTKGNSPASS